MVKDIKIKNRSYYFFNDMIALKDFDEAILEVDKKYHKHIDIYYIDYITIKKMMIIKIFIQQQDILKKKMTINT